MAEKDMVDYPAYVKEALRTISRIMDGNRRNLMDELNRANKGELFVLRFLNMRKEPVLPSELSMALGSSMARVSALLGSLEKKGQINREVNVSDRRNILVTLTEAGKRRAATEMAHMQGCMAKLFEEMGETDTKDFIRLAGRFSELSEKNLRPFPEDGPDER